MQCGKQAIVDTPAVQMDRLSMDKNKIIERKNMVLIKKYEIKSMDKISIEFREESDENNRFINIDGNVFIFSDAIPEFRKIIEEIYDLDKEIKDRGCLYECKKCNNIFKKSELIFSDGDLWCPICDNSTNIEFKSFRKAKKESVKDGKTD